MFQDAQSIDPRVKSILMAAFEAFCHYGVRRTSMEDIAKGAGMSRAALYLHFRNKEDILKGMMEAYYANAYSEVERALMAEGSIPDLLKAAFAAHAGEAFKTLLNSPHGSELLDQNGPVAKDMTHAGNARLVEVYVNWITKEVAAGRMSLTSFDQSAPVVAETLIRALYGLKTGQTSYSEFDRHRDLLAIMLGKSLEK